ncbi:MAG: bifunctional diaminohydroxyphosphoribosylaminopyrimidine deaminase/5-amino-6-(5-phosphoribosylamino)uracil reductase RibD [Candidatus Omnitrophica bacterium]|nr:bifunctional diaminohydroxyphosphoribosylaminopyrimidine deaminase/5-amino-6-(5-phosphoribosylamino)uracil reductase RibD [Candidatus Omnitrophota bacterium]
MDGQEKYMRVAINLAKKGIGHTSPNPAVGAVIVKNGRIVGKGYHKKCGLPHAEVNALKEAGFLAKGATMYVTLEPCNHFGRTPPCTQAIIMSGIRKVVIAMKDPNPITNGRGIKKLKAAGINTSVGILANEAKAINRPFIKAMTRKMPFVTVKVAQSLDGKIATRSGDSRWITDEDSRRYVHRLRRSVDAILVGVNTVLKDDPILLCKLSCAKQPARVIVDSALKTPLNARIFSTIDISPVIIATTSKASFVKKRKYEKRGVEVIFFEGKSGRVDLKKLLRRLAAMGMINILVEGGGEIVASLVEENLADRFLFFIAPKIIGGASAITSVEGRGVESIKEAKEFGSIKIKRFKKDVLLEVERCSPA